VPASTATTDLRRRSVEIIHAGQATSGAYVACPTFPPYQYAWLRDGSFVADAMSRTGEVESAEAFFDWAADVAVARDGRGLAARYTLDGADDDSKWPHEQWDGWGLWLWAVAEHCERHGVSRKRWAGAAQLVAAFLSQAWRTPCTDWWEERVGLHATTLGCVAAGLLAWDMPTRGLLKALHDDADWRVDASLLALVHPLGLVPQERVLPAIRRHLVSPGGGVHRHPDDTYYGGGEWLLLTALDGWVIAALGWLGARARLEWVAAHATPGGELPEQSQDHLLAPERYETWVEKWGPPPSPLLWSHAMYLDLALRLDVA
jgi:GH15 family glucan-1,4-alpha-glucosidase